MKVKDYVKDCTVRFMFYRDGDLWYEVLGGPTCLEFPVPISDIGNAIFQREDKALLFMRYIRKQLEFLDDCKTKSEYECVDCSDSGIVRVSESPSGTFMIPCLCGKGNGG